MKTVLFPLIALGFLAPLSLLHGQNVEELEITGRSSFTAAPSARNPFWPIGWSKESKKAAPVVTKTGTPAPPSDAFFTPERFVVSSISISHLPLAVVNGNAYGEGDLIPFRDGERVVNVQVFSIRDGKVLLRFNQKTIEAQIKTETLQKREAP